MVKYRGIQNPILARGGFDHKINNVPTNNDKS